MQIHGACHCGGISFVAEIDLGRVTLCHCTDCQTMSGADGHLPAEVPGLELLVTQRVP